MLYLIYLSISYSSSSTSRRSKHDSNINWDEIHLFALKKSASCSTYQYHYPTVLKLGQAKYFKAFFVIFVETLFTNWSINLMLWQKLLLSKSSLLLLVSPTLLTLALISSLISVTRDWYLISLSGQTHRTSIGLTLLFFFIYRNNR